LLSSEVPRPPPVFIHFNRIPPNENSAIRICCSHRRPHPSRLHHPGHSERAGRQHSRLRWRRLFFSRHVADLAQSAWRCASRGQPGGSPASKQALYSWTNELLKLAGSRTRWAAPHASLTKRLKVHSCPSAVQSGGEDTLGVQAAPWLQCAGAAFCLVDVRGNYIPSHAHALIALSLAIRSNREGPAAARGLVGDCRR
jgi:hypothetical protein